MLLRTPVVLMATLAASFCPAARAQTDTTFTYQGQLHSAGQPVDADADFRFRLFDALDGGNQIGGELALDAIVVSDGLFDAELDFGADALSGQRWLEIDVRSPHDPTDTEPFTTLSPRQPITAAPFSIQTRGIFVDDKGNVGIGTDTPAAPLHVAEGTLGTGVILPGLRVIQSEVSPTLLGGFSGNTVTDGAVGAVIGGGGRSTSPNTISDDFGAIGGGSNNVTGTEDGDAGNATHASVGGGFGNAASGVGSTVGGGIRNTASSNVSTVGGGQNNIASGDFSTLGGGSRSDASGDLSTIGGGRDNAASGFASTIGGGDFNAASDEGTTVGGGQVNTASGFSSTVGGGTTNTASGASSTVGGGGLNTASGVASTVPGGGSNFAVGDFSFAAGNRAKANHDGAFVWADNTNVEFLSSGSNQFLIRAGGGVGIGTTTPDAQLDVAGTVRIEKSGHQATALELAIDRRWEFRQFGTGASTALELASLDSQGISNKDFIISTDGEVGISTTSPSFKLEVNGSAGKPGGGSWSNSSDRRLKKSINDLEGSLDNLLSLRGVTFEYKDPDAINELHGERIGMVAQEVEAIFPDWVSEGGHGYKTLTFRGFEALTVEALRDLRAEKDSEIAALRNEKDTEIARLGNRLAELELLVQQLGAANSQEESR